MIKINYVNYYMALLREVLGLIYREKKIHSKVSRPNILHNKVM